MTLLNRRFSDVDEVGDKAIHWRWHNEWEGAELQFHQIGLDADDCDLQSH